MSEYFCEASIGVEYDGRAPSIRLCGKPATLRPNTNELTKNIVNEVALCDEHAGETVQGGLHG